MTELIDYKDSILNRGNLYRIKDVMRRAEEGESLTIGFIGGSITQGSLSSSPEKCYAYRTYKWWTDTFPDSQMKYVNAGIGGTTSHFGAARAEDDLLREKPDFVIVEFSVNDENDEHFMETYEGLVRHIYSAESDPAVLLVSNVFYDTGKNAEEIHGKTGKHYDLPHISMKNTIYKAVSEGKIVARDITPDDLHPNDKGHELVAHVITSYLESIRENTEEESIPYDRDTLPAPFTQNTYENAIRINNEDTVHVECSGFTADLTEQKNITDCFKKGWAASKGSASIKFNLKCSGAAVQYRRYVEGNAPAASVYVDGEKNCELHGNFDETWGDKLELTTVCEHLENREHCIEIVIDGDQEYKNPFYVTAVIIAD